MPRSRQVDVWMGKYHDLMTSVIQRIRKIMLENPYIDGPIDWQAPTIAYS